MSGLKITPNVQWETGNWPPWESRPIIMRDITYLPKILENLQEVPPDTEK